MDAGGIAIHQLGHRAQHGRNLPYALCGAQGVYPDLRLQHAFEELQGHAFASWLEVVGLRTLLGRKPATISAAELHEAERRLGIALANAGAMQDLASPLSQHYDSILTISQYLGHASLTTTNRYAKGDLEMKRKAIARVLPITHRSRTPRDKSPTILNWLESL